MKSCGSLFWKRNALACVGFAAILFSAGQVNADSAETGRRLKALEEKAEAYSKIQEWLDRLTFKGDLRLRHESQFKDSPNIDRHRQRIRLRFGAEFHLFKDLDVGFRLVSGDDGNPSDPISTNATLADSFEKKPLKIDRAYARFKVGPFTFTGGKMANPFMRTELVWDSDVNPEGAAEQFKYKIAATGAELFVNLGQFPIDELSGADDDPWLFAFQGGVKQKVGSLGEARLAAAYYGFTDLQGKRVPNFTSGNSVDAGGALLNDFGVLDVIAEMYFDFGVPLLLQAEYTRNLDAMPGNDLNDGFQARLWVNGKVKKAWDWQANYMYRIVEADAVLDALSHSDFHGGGTNARGHQFGLNIGLRKGVYVALTYFNTTTDSGAKTSKSGRDKLQVDLKLKFK